MKAEQYSIIKTTCKNKKEAKILAEILINAKLVACAQISKIESLYLWEGEIHNANEYQLSLKTKSNNYKTIEKLILENHSYKIPQIIEIPIVEGSDDFLKWLAS